MSILRIRAALTLVACSVSCPEPTNAQTPPLPIGRIGISIATNSGPFVVTTLWANMSAANYGVRLGDKVVEVDGKSTKSKAKSEAPRLLRGEPGSSVNLVLEDTSGTKRSVSLVRTPTSFEAWKQANEYALNAFKRRAETWRGLTEKPLLPEETIRCRVHAEQAVREKRFSDALDHFWAGLVTAEYLWPEGNYNAAMLCAEAAEKATRGVSDRGTDLEEKAASAALDYSRAALRMRCYLELVPSAPDRQFALERIAAWDESSRLQRGKVKAIYTNHELPPL